VPIRYLADETRFFETVESWTDEERQAAMPISKRGICKLSAANRSMALRPGGKSRR
jgi:hypothetical protein